MLKKTLFLLTCFLLAFIPLWPKLPLFQIIPGYIVRVRLEDIFVLIALIIYLILLFQKKISLKTPLNRAVALYLGAGAVSLLVAIFLIQSIPLQTLHIAKSLLHLLRYTEYFFLFFLTYEIASGSKKKQLILVSVLLMTTLLTSLYGIGQRYFAFPAFSTMNWEFSKGIALELPSSSSRVISTFAGHYDFAIFIALLLPWAVHRFLTKKEKQCKVVSSIVFLFALWGLFAASLRIAFVSYALGTGLTILLITLKQINPKKKLDIFLKTLAIRYAAISAISILFLFLFGQNLLNLVQHAFYSATTDTSERTVEEAIVEQYQPPRPKNPELQSLLDNGQPTELSECARTGELSLCVRLESLWPAAIRGFGQNPITGTGYGTLNKVDREHISAADGTDNNYLRILGETGSLGFLAFGFLLLVSAKHSWRKPYMAPYYGSLLGMLIAAILFDVFAASKVAFTFWGLTGIALAGKSERS